MPYTSTFETTNNNSHNSQSISHNNHNNILERLRENDPTLTKLKLVHPPNSYYNDAAAPTLLWCANSSISHGFEDLLDCLQNNTTVTYVLVERDFVRGLSQANVGRAFEAIGRMTQLMEIELWSLRLPFTALCQALSKASKLQRLGMGFVSLVASNDGGRLDASALARHPSLRKVCISDFRFSHDNGNGRDIHPSLDSLLESLATCPCLDVVQLFEYQQRRPPLSAKGLAALLASPSLTQLTLRRMKLRAEDVKLLLPHNNIQSSQLRSLDLTENKLGDNGATDLVQTLMQGSYNASLRELDLSHNQITSEGCIAVCRALVQTNVGLESLTLARNPVGDQGAALGLAPLLAIHPNLQTLVVHRTELTDAGCKPLMESLRRNSSLVHLDVSLNPFTEATYISASDALKDNNTLRNLNLQVNCKLKGSIAACQALLDMLKVNTSLQQISTLLRLRLFEPHDYYPVESLLQQINLFLTLNHTGRRGRLLRGQATVSEWGHALTSVQDDLNGIYYLLQANPALSHFFLMAMEEKEKDPHQ